MDPTKEQAAERGYMQNGTVAWSDAVIAHGEDPDRVLETREKDAERFKAAGLPEIPGIPDPSKAAGSGAGGPPAGKDAGTRGREDAKAAKK